MHAQDAEIIDLERKYWKAIQDKDAATAMALTDDTVLLTGAQGVSRHARADFEAMLEASNYTLHRFELSDTEVQRLGDDVAVVAYKVHEELTVDGKPVTVDAADASTWVRRNGKWVCALHTEAIEGDPYGRDRVGGSAVVREAPAFRLEPSRPPR